MKVIQITLRIALCEDSDEDAALLTRYIEDSAIPAKVTRFENGGAFLAAVQPGGFHLIFMDIYLDGIDGIEASRILREADGDCAIVFTTNSREHALDAFGVDAQQYLVKPLAQGDVDAVLRRQLKIVERSGREVCRVRAKGTSMDIPLDQIFYIEVQNHKCLLRTADGIIDTGSSMKIKDFTLLLPAPRFLHCHHSYIVNLDYVKDVSEHGDFIMEDGDIVYTRVKNGKKMTDAWRHYVYQSVRDRRG